MASIWEQYNFEARITEILADVQTTTEAHHFGRPYMSAYQLAIEFSQRAPDAVEALGYPIGGEAAGKPNSLAQYIAGELSRRIKNGSIQDIEGSFLSRRHLNDINFNNRGTSIRASTTDAGFDLSMFRLRRDR